MSTEFVILLVAIAIAVVAIRSSIAKRPLAATGSDWFVVFDVNAEQKVLGLSFFPVVGFQRLENQTVPITSRPDYTKKLASIRPAKINPEGGMWGVSVSYGRWVRDGALFDELGNPEHTDSSNFSNIVENYLLGAFKLHFATPIPESYLQQIESASARAKREA